MNAIAKPVPASRHWLRALEAVSGLDQDPRRCFGTILNDMAETHGANPALIDETHALSYRELAHLANRYADWARQNFAPGAAIALLMRNCAEYVAIWAGLSQAGITVALINTNLTGTPLVHAIRAAAAKAVIVEAELTDVIQETQADLAELPVWTHGAADSGEHAEWPRIDHAILAHSTARPPAIDAAAAPALLIYTSGTTGLPKAAKISHARVLQWSYWFAGLMETEERDRLYNCLPLYHSTGGVCAIGAVLVRGGAAIIRRRFSVSRFWQDVTETGATIFQHIGELCRYLLRAEPGPYEERHGLRLCCGNGLREEVWREFERRFRIPRILEFYAATEGAVSLYNCDGKPGAIGRVPGFLAHRFPLALVQCDPATGEHPRGESGFCLPCEANEIGEAIGRLDPEHTSARFEGYADAAQSGKKLLRDVFREGDLWYRTGDLMRRDEAGYYYFVDRLGDAFRWKGENVSASEVAAVIANCPGVVDAVVFGVRLPHHEGQAGMAAIAIDREFDLAILRAELIRRLPTYARPVFIRRCDAIDRTATFKLSAARLKQDGYIHAPTHDLWFDDRKANAYTPFGTAQRLMLESGVLRT